MRKMTSKQVRAAFNREWREMVMLNPRLRTDKPAKHEQFSYFIDELHRAGKITDHVVNKVTLD